MKIKNLQLNNKKLQQVIASGLILVQLITLTGCKNKEKKENEEITETIIYTVEEGDSLSSIANEFGVSTFKLARDNERLIVRTIYPGQILEINGVDEINAIEYRREYGTTIEYKIKETDTFESIAEYFGITVREITEYNKISQLEPGQIIQIPGVLEEYEYKYYEDEKVNVQYTIKYGDNLWNIAQYFGVTVDSIIEYNDLGTKSFIQPGDIIIIPKVDPEIANEYKKTLEQTANNTNVNSESPYQTMSLSMRKKH